MSGRECVASLLDMRCCIVKDQDMVIVRVALLDNFDCFFGMLDNVLIGIVSIMSFTGLEQNASGFSAIR